MASPDFAEHFGLQNVPFGVASSPSHPAPQCVTRVGDQVIFLASLAKNSFFDGIEGLPPNVSLTQVFSQPTLNAFAALPKTVHRAVRSVVQNISSDLRRQSLTQHTLSITDVSLHVPVSVGDFTDFSASKNHVLNAGEAVLGKRFLPSAFLTHPIGYGGRSSSIVVSGTPVERPIGCFRKGEGEKAEVVCKSSEQLDYELEVGVVIGKPTEIGQRISVNKAEEHIFGFILLNDWSTRDIQGFEMQPLGPLNSKNFTTSISPWVISLDALSPYRIPLESQDDTVAPYLTAPGYRPSTFSVDLSVEIVSKGITTTTCRTNMQYLYWSIEQMIAHQTISGCSLRTGDILATGTVSGGDQGDKGCLLEVTKGGEESVKMTDGSEKFYLDDGDLVRLTGTAAPGIGFGECVGTVEPAKPWP